MFFKTDSVGKAKALRLNTGYRSLDIKLKRTVLKYLSSGILDGYKFNSPRNYIQLFKRADDNLEVDASSVIVSDTQPVYQKDGEASKRLILALYDFLIEKVELSKVKGELSKLDIYFKLTFTLSKEGEIKNLKITSEKSESFDAYMLELLEQFTKGKVIPVKRNGIPITSKIVYPIHLNIVNRSFETAEVLSLTDNVLNKRFDSIRERSGDKLISLDSLKLIPVNWKKEKMSFTFNKSKRLDNLWFQSQKIFGGGTFTFSRKGFFEKVRKLLNDEMIEKFNISFSIDRIYTIEYFRRSKDIRFTENLGWSSIGYFKACKSCGNIFELIDHNLKSVTAIIQRELQQAFNDHQIKVINGDLKKNRRGLNRVGYKKNQEGKLKPKYDLALKYYPHITKDVIEEPNEEYKEYVLLEKNHFKLKLYSLMCTGKIQNTTKIPSYSQFEQTDYEDEEIKKLYHRVTEILKNKIVFEKKPMINGKISKAVLPFVNIIFEPTN